MQTLKTAAIVVLLMTIIYGAYVSLTTPPEPLPPEVEGMLVMTEDDAFSIDDGLPGSLPGLDAGQPAGADSLSSLELPSIGEPSVGPAAMLPMASENENAVVGTLSDHSASLVGGNDSQPSDLAAGAFPSSPVPSADVPSADVAPKAALAAPSVDVAVGGADDDYPSTGKEFALPDMKGMDVKFQTASSVKPSLPNLEGTPLPGIAPVESAASASQFNAGVANAIRTADAQFAQDKMKEALATLSLFYHSPSLSGEQRSDLLSRLDPLAREVVYSKRHLLEQPYRVGQSETLMQVAARFEVPWQLLANINQIKDPVTVLPGTELKVVRGPFRAEVNLEQQELTLFLGDLYAGRFPVAVGSDPAPRPGTFTVQDKQTARTYYDPSGSPVPAGSADNPYGDVWIDLGGQLCIHGSPSTTRPNDKGCISLAGDLATDLYGILSQGSSVTIR